MNHALLMTNSKAADTLRSYLSGHTSVTAVEVEGNIFTVRLNCHISARPLCAAIPNVRGLFGTKMKFLGTDRIVGEFQDA